MHARACKPVHAHAVGYLQVEPTFRLRFCAKMVRVARSIPASSRSFSLNILSSGGVRSRRLGAWKLHGNRSDKHACSPVLVLGSCMAGQTSMHAPAGCLGCMAIGQMACMLPPCLCLVAAWSCDPPRHPVPIVPASPVPLAPLFSAAAAASTVLLAVSRAAAISSGALPVPTLAPALSRACFLLLIACLGLGLKLLLQVIVVVLHCRCEYFCPNFRESHHSGMESANAEPTFGEKLQAHLVKQPRFVRVSGLHAPLLHACAPTPNPLSACMRAGADSRGVGWGLSQNGDSAA